MMKFARSLSILALAGLAFGGPAMAQLKSQAPQPQASQENPQQLMQSYRDKTQQLNEIQAKALKDNPKLSAEMDHYQNEFNASMRTHGYDIVKGKKRVQAMVAELRSGKKMSDADRAKTLKSYQDETKRMLKARDAAMKDPKVQKDRKALAHDMIAAMTKEDSRTPQLIKEMNALRAKMMKFMQAHRTSN